MKNGCAALVVVLLLLVGIASCLPGSDEQLSSDRSSLADVDPEALAKVEAFLKEWTVSTRTDQLSGKSYPYASLSSSNKINLAFPYKETGLTIEYWRHPSEGRQMLFSIDDGQLTCGVWDCQGQISFDGKVETLSLRTATDHSSKYLFAAHPEAILRKMNKAQKTVISLTLYQAGSPAFIFEPSKPLEFKE